MPSSYGDKNKTIKEHIHNTKLWPLLRRRDEVNEEPVIRLLDSDWLLNTEKRRICARQDLPEDAFISAETLVKNTPEGSSISKFYNRVLVISYMWMKWDHPDPKGITLKTLQQALRLFVLERTYNAFWQQSAMYGSTPQHVVHKEKRRFGIFWDFASLPQKRQLEDGGFGRLPQEQEMFEKGLGGISYLFLHPLTVVFKLTQSVASETPASSHNQRGYFDRGWTFTEHSWSSLAKRASWKVFDLGKIQDWGDETLDYEKMQKQCAMGNTLPSPLLPHVFDDRIDSRSFLREEDRGQVKELYRESFATVFGMVEALDYGNYGWTDSNALELTQVLEGSSARELYLHGNRFSQRCCEHLTQVLKATNIVVLDIGSNVDIGDAGIQLLVSGFVNLERLSVRRIGMTEKGCDSLATLSRLVELDVSENRVGDRGADCLVRSMRSISKLSLCGCGLTDEAYEPIAKLGESCRTLDLSENLLTDNGVSQIMAKNALARMLHLELNKCKITVEACKVLVQLSHIVNLALSENAVGDSGATELQPLLCANLEVLVLCGCGLKTLWVDVETHSPWPKLQTLDLKRNDICNTTPLERVLDMAPELKILDVRGNPIDGDTSTLRDSCRTRQIKIKL